MTYRRPDPPQMGNGKHQATTLRRLLRQPGLVSQLDQRSRLARFVQRERRALVEHLGGSPSATEERIILVASIQAALCASLSDYLLRKEAQAQEDGRPGHGLMRTEHGQVVEGEPSRVVPTLQGALRDYASTLHQLGMAARLPPAKSIAEIMAEETTT